MKIRLQNSGWHNMQQSFVDEDHLHGKERRPSALLTAITLCLLTSGCGNGLSSVSGVVTVDGEPFQVGENVKATVYFQSASGGGAGGVGILNENGEYTLSTGSQNGIEPGNYLVTFSATEIVPSRSKGGTPTGKRVSNPKYASAKTSGLSFEVKRGSNEYNIELSSN